MIHSIHILHITHPCIIGYSHGIWYIYQICHTWHSWYTASISYISHIPHPPVCMTIVSHTCYTHKDGTGSWYMYPCHIWIYEYGYTYISKDHSTQSYKPCLSHATSSPAQSCDCCYCIVLHSCCGTVHCNTLLYSGGKCADSSKKCGCHMWLCIVKLYIHTLL